MSQLPSHHGPKESDRSDHPDPTVRLLLNRSSLRLFAERPVEPDVQRTLFEAATRAPSGGNLQPFSIIKVEAPETAARLCELVGGQAFVGRAPLNLLFCLDWHRLRRWAELEKAPFSAHRSFRHFWIALQDTAMAAQNLCTAADALGLGSVYVGSVIDCFRELKALFSLPDLVVPLVLVSLGYPRAPQGRRLKFNPATLVHDGAYRDPSDAELLAAFEAKYPGQKVVITPERLEKIAAVCRTVHGPAFAEECLAAIRARGYINPVQRYFGLHYAADEMPAGNPEFLSMLKEFGFDCFERFEAAGE